MTGETLGQRLRMLRGSASQGDFAARIGVNKNLLGKYERNENRPGSEFLMALQKKTQVNLNWLLGGDGDPTTGREPPRARGEDAQTERLSQLIEMVATDLAGLASRTNLTWKALDALREGSVKPTARQLDSLLKATKASRTWLETGEGDMFDTPPAPQPLAGTVLGESCPPPSPPPLEVDLLEEVIFLVEDWLQGNQQALTPGKKAKILTEFYKMAVESRQRKEPLNKDNIRRMLHLASRL